ncbi:SIS domain-containing protein [Candidatus Pelagibacter sp.]|mgnify:FL=1|nr:SIS domain-containing protein [Candidatus Pelagibacter sp.]
MNNFKFFLQSYISNLSNSILSADIESMDKAAKLIFSTIKKRKTIYVCGNGGSAAIANHYVCDFLKFFRQKTKYMPKIISLSNSIETITAIANDIDYSKVFSYQVESLCEKNDLIIIISSSGNSKNIIEIIKTAKKKGITTLGFSGFKGGYLKKESDISVHIAAENYGISEDSHHVLMHVLLQYLIKFFEKKI